MESDEPEKLPSSPRRFILVFACFIIAAVLGFKFMFTRLFMPSTAEAKKLEVKKSYDVANNHHLVNPDNTDKKTRSLIPPKNVVRQGHFVKLVNDDKLQPVKTAKKTTRVKNPPANKKVELLENYGCNEDDCYMIKDGRIISVKNHSGG